MYASWVVKEGEKKTALEKRREDLNQPFSHNVLRRGGGGEKEGMSDSL